MLSRALFCLLAVLLGVAVQVNCASLHKPQSYKRETSSFRVTPDNSAVNENEAIPISYFSANSKSPLRSTVSSGSSHAPSQSGHYAPSTSGNYELFGAAALADYGTDAGGPTYEALSMDQNAGNWRDDDDSDDEYENEASASGGAYGGPGGYNGGAIAVIQSGGGGGYGGGGYGGGGYGGGGYGGGGCGGGGCGGPQLYAAIPYAPAPIAFRPVAYAPAPISLSPVLIPRPSPLPVATAPIPESSSSSKSLSLPGLDKFSGLGSGLEDKFSGLTDIFSGLGDKLGELEKLLPLKSMPSISLPDKSSLESLKGLLDGLGSLPIPSLSINMPDTNGPGKQQLLEQLLAAGDKLMPAIHIPSKAPIIMASASAPIPAPVPAPIPAPYPIPVPMPIPVPIPSPSKGLGLGSLKPDLSKFKLPELPSLDSLGSSLGGLSDLFSKFPKLEIVKKVQKPAPHVPIPAPLPPPSKIVSAYPMQRGHVVVEDYPYGRPQYGPLDDGGESPLGCAQLDSAIPVPVAPGGGGGAY